ncbi:MAG: cyanophycin synthetase [Mariprofundaceae bacterium]|nr:cyanophycin synthetase [Mariprofundaceae bacterium]
MSMQAKGSVEGWLAGLGSPAADRDYKPGHARMLDLLAGMQLRRPRLRIRIAGTNGKGSTAHMLAAGLACAGLKVGLYTSPHIHSFNERIRIDAQAIDDAELLRFLPPIVERAMHIGASYFEVATALALQCFSGAQVDVEILEAGVGARLDATTAVPADMALLTPVALDHQAWLGDTLQDIASEKAHVFVACRWCFSAAQNEAVRRVVDGVQSGVRYLTAPIEMPLAMRGAHQQSNAALALAALAALQSDGALSASDGAMAGIRKAVAGVQVPGRLQRVGLGEKVFWLDAGHNRHAIEALLPGLKEIGPFEAIFVFTREDRDLTDTLPLLRSLTNRLISGSPTDMADACYDSVAQALQYETHGEGCYLVLGSFITVCAAEDWLSARQ